MPASDNTVFDSALDAVVSSFIETVRQRSDYWNYRSGRSFTNEFPILGIADESFYKYERREEFLRFLVRVKLANPMIAEALAAHDITVYFLNTPDYSSTGWDTDSFEESYPFEFIVDTGKQRIGCRYTGLYCDNRKLRRLFKSNRLNQIAIISWDESRLELHDYYSHNKQSSLWKSIIYTTLEDFLLQFLTKSEYQTILNRMRTAVKAANEIIGFRTIPQLSSWYLSSFQEIVLGRLSDYITSEKNYVPLKQRSFHHRYSEDDVRKLNKAFFEDARYRALAGTKGFAKCFITAEYLYDVFQNGGAFDYTSIICGYLKCVEQLAFELMAGTVPDEKNLWIKKNRKKAPKHLWDNRSPFEWKDSMPHVLFKEENATYFDTSLGSLVNFLHDNESDWRVSTEGRHFILEVLRAYADECRNEHFHKDNIETFSEAERVRNNTLFVLYLLLGGYCLSDDAAKEAAVLGIVDDAFASLYRNLKSIPAGQHRFVLQFKGQEPIHAYRLYDQEATQFDEYGRPSSAIVFVTTSFAGIDSNEQYERFLRELRDEEIIRVSPDNIPEKCWLVLFDGTMKVIK